MTDPTNTFRALTPGDRDRSAHRRPLGQTVRVLDIDPDLAEGIDANQRGLAARHAVARVIDVQRGPWQFPPLQSGGLGALILKGLIIVRVQFAGVRGHVELLGEGDLVRPWLGIGTEVTAPCVVTADVLSGLQVALLDRPFALRTARWPEIIDALMQRLLVRSRILSMQSAINSLPRIEERLETTLWQLAYRFGHVTREGIILELPITHLQLAEIVSAQRPSVTIALTRLRERGNVTLLRRHQWLLRGEPPQLAVPVARPPRESAGSVAKISPHQVACQRED
jgi:CRP/FNR family transcriptional regulator, cyclic AMP receptor protein